MAVLLAALLAGCGEAEGAGPQRPPYRCGAAMAPDSVEAAAEIRRSWAEWKERYVTTQGAGGALRVRMPGYGKDNSSSEGIGYGMLLAAYLGDRPVLDGLWRYAKRYHNRRGLMSWEVDPAGRVPDSNAATDGDQDMAFALVRADARWGGYRADARALIDSLMAHTVEPGTYVLKPGDVWGGSRVTNPSYFAPAYYRVFAAYTGDRRWERVIDANYGVLARLTARPGNSTGLFPGWSTAAGDSSTAGHFSFHYDFGAARVPWRLAMDAAWSCDPRARRHLDRLNAFWKKVGPEEIREGYTLAGRPVGSSHNVSFIAPAAAGAIVSPDAGFRRKMWEETVATRDGAYYGDSLRLLAMVFMSGGMPPPKVPSARG